MTSTLFVMITGASKGIGRSCAISLAQDSNIDKLHLCLLSRNLDELQITSQLVTECVCHNSINKKDVHVSLHPIDLSDVYNLENNVEAILSQCLPPKNQTEQKCTSNISPPSLFTNDIIHYILINNAGSLGHLGPTTMKKNTPITLRQNVDMNVVSSCWLSSFFIRFIMNKDKEEKKSNHNGLMSKQCTVVNMSSLCAIQPFPTMATYCAGKAYRDMYHKTMAIEMNHYDSIKILNYAPGAIKTEMTNQLGTCNDLDPNLKDFFQEAVVRNDIDVNANNCENDNNNKEESKFVKVEDTTKKLVNLILNGNYASGAHIDYWDDP